MSAQSCFQVWGVVSAIPWSCTDEAIHLFVLLCDGFVALCVHGLARDEGGKRSGQHRYVHMRCRGTLPYVSWLELGVSLMFVLLMCFLFRLALKHEAA